MKKIKLLEDTQEFSPKNVNWESRADMFEHVIDHMLHYKNDMLCLTGSTGIGKTTFVKQLATILGIDILAVEVPHISMEQIINIPYLIVRDGKNINKDKIETPDLVLAVSNLRKKLQTLQKRTDQEWNNRMQTWPQDLKAIFAFFTPETKKNIAKIRSMYNGILFFDEYWRTVEREVRQVLIAIEGGEIGQDKLPKDIYVISASNLKDTGATLEKPTSGAVLRPLEYQAPTKDQFFYYLTSRAKIPIKKQVLDAFYPIMIDQHLDYDDENTEVRTSSRRWEQILKYINASIPVKSNENAQNLISNIKSMFQDDEKISDLWKFVVQPVLIKLIKDTAPESVKLGTLTSTKPSDWDKTFEHQIETKIKLGDERSYIPVIFGRPKVGKSSVVTKVAEKFNLLPIKINCEHLKSTDVIGLPLPGKYIEDKKQKMSTEFSQPPLRKLIVEEAKKELAEFKKYASVEQRKKWLDSTYKYLLIFDNLNKVSTQNTYNVLRRLILEKEFNDKWSLPEHMIVVASITPSKYDNTVHDLSVHLKDSIDLIQSEPSIEKLNQHLSGLDKTKFKDFNPEIKQSAKTILSSFMEKFAHTEENNSEPDHTRINKESVPFFLRTSSMSTDVTPENSEYISPKDYENLYTYILQGLSSKISSLRGKSLEDLAASTSKFIFDKFKMVLNGIFHKSSENNEFLDEVKSWLNSNMIAFLSSTGRKPKLEYMLDNVLEDKSYHLANDENWHKYMDNTQPNIFQTDFSNYIQGLISKVESKHHIFSKDVTNKKAKTDNGIETLNDMCSALHAVTWDLHNAIVDNYSLEFLEIIKNVIDNVVEDAMHEIADQEKGTPEYQKLENYIEKVILPRLQDLPLEA